MPYTPNNCVGVREISNEVQDLNTSSGVVIRDISDLLLDENISLSDSVERNGMRHHYEIIYFSFQFEMTIFIVYAESVGVDDPKNLAKEFVLNLLQSSYRGQLICTGYELDKKNREKRAEEEILELDHNKNGGNPIGDENPSNDECEEVSELVYVPEDKRSFNRYTLATIIIENEFFLKKFQ